MAEQSQEAPETGDVPRKGSKKPLVIGILLAFLGGGGGFYASWSGLIMAGESPESDKSDPHKEMTVKEDVAYVEVDPITISLRHDSNARHLRFRANLEVTPAARSEVEKVLPRVTDVLNSYLRALDPAELENPATLMRLRAQMLRRIEVVVGPGRVRDLLIMEFVLT